LSQLSIMDMTTRQTTNKEAEDLNKTTNQPDMWTSQSPHLSSRAHVCLKGTWNIFSLDHRLGHKTNLSQIKRTEVLQNVLCEHNGKK
jgi:hypothetical protein